MAIRVIITSPSYYQGQGKGLLSFNHNATRKNVDITHVCLAKCPRPQQQKPWKNICFLFIWYAWDGQHERQLAFFLQALWLSPSRKVVKVQHPAWLSREDPGIWSMPGEGPIWAVVSLCGSSPKCLFRAKQYRHLSPGWYRYLPTSEAYHAIRNLLLSMHSRARRVSRVWIWEQEYMQKRLISHTGPVWFQKPLSQCSTERFAIPSFFMIILSVNINLKI